MSLRQFVCVLVLVALAPLGVAQNVKPGTKYYDNAEFGFRFKPPTEYAGVPLTPGMSETGLTARFTGPEALVSIKNGSYNAPRLLAVFALVAPPAPEAKEGETAAAPKRPDITEALRVVESRFDRTSKPALDQTVKLGKLEARHRVWKLNQQSGVGEWVEVYDVWTFVMPLADISLVFTTPDGDKVDKTLDVFEKSAKTFGPLEGKPGDAPKEIGGNAYEDQLARASAEAASTPGGKWRALPTPSQKYIIKTSAENKKFVDEAIMRLEKSRELYERDFPPTEAFNHVSIVRVCGTEEEFHTYGGTGGGVAGWFNPGTTELVLYDAKNIDRNMTYAVMSHEAFHQYCHFLFGESEAHRWFDEGHGDYYGGAEFKGSKAIITPRMPAGLDRLGEIREMMQMQSYKPLKQHLNFNHGQWQGQGPSNVSCYAQSWSIIYMLREGSVGHIKNNKLWKPEYAQIIPNYVKTLNHGFRAFYEERRAPIRERAKNEGREPTPEELHIDFVPEEKKQAIWKAAMDASWGQVDLDEFEKRWVEYVMKDLK
jgi:hypothetical protein